MVRTGHGMVSNGSVTDWRTDHPVLLRSGALHPFSRAEHEANRRAGEGQRLAELVLEVAAIGEVQRLVDVREERDRRRPGLQLRGVVEAARFSLDARRLMRGQ